MNFTPFLSVLVLLGWLFPLGSSAQLETATIDQLFAQEHAERQFSGSVLIAHKGDVLYQKAWGWSDHEQQFPLTADTPLRIASITKAITAVLVMQLVEEQLISLDQTVAELLPDLEAPQAKKVRLDQLLLHTSGLPNEADNDYLLPQAPHELVVSVAARSKGSKRGRFNYNNVDYWILGLIIEKYRGQSWDSLVQDRILTPLQMDKTGFLQAKALPAKLATNYLITPDGDWVAEPSYAIENFYAAGCMYSTAGDLLKFDQALYTDQLLSSASIEQMYVSHPELGYVAFGNWVYNYPFVGSYPLLVERRGGILGANAVFIRFLDTRHTLIILSNNDQFNPDSFGQTEHIKEQMIRLIAADTGAAAISDQ